MNKEISAAYSDVRFGVTIPAGFSYKEGTIDTGYVIKDMDGNEYVHIPSGYNTEGTYVRGFWLSRYEISEGKDKTPQSKANEVPWVDINYYDALAVAESIGAYLISKEEYGRICMWLVETGAATFEQVYVNGKDLGNYSRSSILAKTGSNPNWVCNNIYDFFGNGYTWTTEKSELYDHHRVIKGGHGMEFGSERCYPPSNRCWEKPNICRSNITFRIVIHNNGEETEEKT